MIARADAVVWTCADEFSAERRGCEFELRGSPRACRRADFLVSTPATPAIARAARYASATRRIVGRAGNERQTEAAFAALLQAAA